MLDSIFTALKFAFRQRHAFMSALDMMKSLATFKVPFTKIGASLLAVLELFTAAFLDTPRTPRGDQLDLTGYELVFEDEFECDQLNKDVWEMSSGYEDQISFRDGNMIMSADFYETDNSWHLASIGTKELFCKGYYEIRCKVFPNNSRGDIWSAFWITGDGVYDPDVSKGGVGGCEIDIYESFCDTDRGRTLPDTITPAIWCNGVDEDENIDGVNLGKWYADDPANKYNTYGLLWTDEYYIWYINGVEALRVNYGSGPSQVPESVLVSLCHPALTVDKMSRAKDDPAEYVVDYVKIYQLSE